MEVRGQFVEIRAFSFHGVGPGDRAHIISLGSKGPDALSYLNSLVSPSEWYIKQTYTFQSMGVLSSSSYNQVIILCILLWILGLRDRSQQLETSWRD